MDESDKKYLKTLGNKIRELRGDMTQVEFGSKIGDSKHAFIGRVERGEQNCTIITLRKIAKVLGVSVKDLLDFDE